MLVCEEINNKNVTDKNSINIVESNKKAPLNQGAVVYTDGSARPSNPGYIGWGAHGYIFDIVDVDKPTSIDGHILTAKGYISESLLDKNTVLIKPLKYIDGLGSNDVKGSNNSAELQALYYTLDYLITCDVMTVNIFSDSEYVIRGVNEKLDIWNRYNWLNRDGTNIPNNEWWKKIHNVLQVMKSKNIVFTIAWVKAHSGIFGNEQADILAVTGMNYSVYQRTQNQFVLTDAKDYWDIEKHPFLNFKRIYFNSVKTFNTLGNYYQADSGASDYIIGKRIPESGFSIIRLVECDPVIEAIKHKQYDVANDMNAIIMMMLDKVFSKDIYRYLKNHGKYCLLKSKNNLGVSFINDNPIPVTVEINPTGLSLRAIESLNYLEEILDKFLNAKHDDSNKITTTESLNWHDITDKFYDIETKSVKGKEVTKYSLNKDLIVGMKDIKLEVNELVNGELKKIIVPVILGLDLLPRNNLKKLETHDPKVYLITWRESSFSIRYATVIECTSGVGIWSNFFADKILL